MGRKWEQLKEKKKDSQSENLKEKTKEMLMGLVLDSERERESE